MREGGREGVGGGVCVRGGGVGGEGLGLRGVELRRGLLVWSGPHPLLCRHRGDKPFLDARQCVEAVPATRLCRWMLEEFFSLQCPWLQAAGELFSASGL